MLLIAAAAAAAPAASRRVSDETELRSLFTDRELSDSMHYVYQFKRDGRLGGEEMGRGVQGQWQIKEHSLCLNWSLPAGVRECYEVRLAGREVQLLRHGREMYFGTLAPLKPLR